MRIYFLRHGETDWNVARRIQGRTDIALNSMGVRQATLWRPFFEQIPLAGVYSSSLSRAMETAVLASSRPPCVIDGLDERNYGEWEGRVWNDIAGDEPDFDLRWRRPDSSPPRGESRLEMHERVYRAMDFIVATHDSDSELLIVAHGGSGKAVLGYANKMSIEELFAIPAIGNATMTILTREGERWSVSKPQLPGMLPDQVPCRAGL
jgi:broad specificity phosphatase PhoE